MALTLSDHPWRQWLVRAVAAALLVWMLGGLGFARLAYSVVLVLAGVALAGAGAASGLVTAGLLGFWLTHRTATVAAGVALPSSALRAAAPRAHPSLDAQHCERPGLRDVADAHAAAPRGRAQETAE